MNAKDKQMIEDFLARTKPKKPIRRRVSKKEQEQLKRIQRREMIEDLVILAFVITAGVIVSVLIIWGLYG